MPTNVQIDGSRIMDWDSFHDYFAVRFGFPGFYGRNMDAWIDCMTCLDAPDEDLSSFHVPAGETVVLCISDADALKKRCAEVLESLVECSAFVNWRRIEMRKPAILALSFNA
jgi:hypothetical protein